MGLSRKGSRGRALQLARDPPGGALAERLSRTGSRRGISQIGNPASEIPASDSKSEEELQLGEALHSGSKSEVEVRWEDFTEEQAWDVSHATSASDSKSEEELAMVKAWARAYIMPCPCFSHPQFRLGLGIRGGSGMGHVPCLFRLEVLQSGFHLGFGIRSKVGLDNSHTEFASSRFKACSAAFLSWKLKGISVALV